MGTIMFLVFGCLGLVLLFAVFSSQSEETRHLRDLELRDQMDTNRMLEAERRDEARRLEAERREEQRRLERADERSLELGVRALELQLANIKAKHDALDRENAMLKSRLEGYTRAEQPIDPRAVDAVEPVDDHVVEGVDPDEYVGH